MVLSVWEASAQSSDGGYVYGQSDYSYWPDGYNTWFEVGPYLSEALITNAVLRMLTNGAYAAGIRSIHLDGSDFTNVDANGIPMMDGTSFPHGFPWLANFIETNGFRLGVYGVVSNNLALSGEPGDYYFFGHELAGANYFLTNGVTYFKFDAPPNCVDPQNGVDVWPDISDYFGNIMTPFSTADVWDDSYLKFVTACQQSPQPIFFNASIRTAGTNYGSNIPMLLNSWRYTQDSFTNSVGMVFNGDMTGAQQEFLLWNWIAVAATETPPISNWHYPDFDPLGNWMVPGFERRMYAAAMFGSIFELGSSGIPDDYQPWAHSPTNELTNPLLHAIRARGTIPHYAYTTNGCVLYEKDNASGGKDVLVLNENYNVYQGDGSGTVETPDLWWGHLTGTNSFNYNGTNYYWAFWATNAILDFARLGLTGSNCLVQTINLNRTATDYATGSLSDFVKEAGANLYTINPVSSFPVPAASSASILGAPWFNFWSTNYSANPFTDTEPSVQSFNIDGVTAPTMFLGGAVYYPINGAASFQCLAGSDIYMTAYGSSENFLVDGQLVATTMVWRASSIYTNILIHFAPTNHFLEIQTVQTGDDPYMIGELQAAQFNYLVPPELTIARTGNNVVVTWPTNSPGFLLQSNVKLGNPNGWKALPTPYPVIGTNFGVTNAIGPTPIFYRLSGQ